MAFYRGLFSAIVGITKFSILSSSNLPNPKSAYQDQPRDIRMSRDDDNLALSTLIVTIIKMLRAISGEISKQNYV
jgi:hypothetical protein